MADEIIVKVRADVDGFKADMDEAKKIGNSAIQDIEKNDLFAKAAANAKDLKESLKLIAKASGEVRLDNFNVDEVVNDTQKLKKLIESLNQSLKGMKAGTTEFNSLDSIIKSANLQLSKLNETTEVTGKSIRTQMRSSVQEVQNLVNKYGLTSKAAMEAAQRAGDLKDTVGDANDLINAFKPGAGFGAVTKAASGVVGAFSAVQGAMNLINSDSKAVEQAILKVQSAMALSQGLQGLSEARDSFKILQVRAMAALNSIKTGIAATGVGLLVVALGALYTYWDDIKEILGGVTEEQKKYNESLLLGQKAGEEARSKIIEVGIAFERAKQGTISKEKALKIYNETLGDSIGEAKTLEEAEKLYSNNTERYISASVQRAAAQELIKKASQKRVEAETQNELNLSDKLLTMTSVYGIMRNNTESNLLKKRKAEKIKEAQDDEKLALQFLKNVDNLKINFDKKDKNKKEKKKEKTPEEKALEVYQKNLEDATKRGIELNAAEKQKIIEANQKANEQIEDSIISREEAEKRAVNDKYFYLITKAKQFGIDTTEFEKAQTLELKAINDKYRKEEEKAEADQVEYQKKLDQQSYKNWKEQEDKKLKDILDRQKKLVDELLTFAENGILLQIGLNPQDVERVKGTVDSFIKSLNDKNASPEERFAKGAEAAQAAYQTVSGAIFAADTQRREKEMSALQAQKDEEIRLAGDNEQKKEVIRQKYALKEKEIKRKQAEADKKKAIMDATIKTAVAVISAIAQSPLTLGMPWAAIVAGLGAAEIAMIAATPIPKFAKGGQISGGLLEGRPHSAGGILVEAEGKEYITNREQSMSNLGLLEAINMSDSDRDNYINRHYVMPALQAKESKANENRRNSQIEAENNLIARVSSHTLKSIHREQKNTTEAIKRLDKKDFKW